ncbi:DUF305 domain-containing protein [Calothrix sp. PCC 7507]|uniref:DUF305 domain-containing protein n=1 Tax=Calothrix sp. PCC 7507 TaxID=99598 RepID=UPI00029EDE30|nr:DUF305 domain-containing protein [Calothrix sp. PCC 7507]AFY36267.1 protein of unknown function DUF305 [Calothrix sp. PCC 7507]
MKNKNLIYGLIGLLSSSAIGGLLIINSTQAQTPNPGHNTHHPSPEITPSPQRGMMNQVDQHFMEMMVPHHRQALEMAELALSRAQHPEIKNLAVVIKKDQNREIQQMQTWYKAWYGKEVPVTAMTHQEMMARHQGMSQQMNPEMMKMPMNQNMRGMNVNLETLKNAPDFDKEFIRQMIPHHRMAVEMSKMAAKKTHKPKIRNLAQSIIKTQTAEINQMQQWYQAWYQSKPEEN